MSHRHARLMTAVDLAELLQKPLSWIYDNLALLPKHIRVGRQLRWTPAAVEAWLDDLADSA